MDLLVIAGIGIIIMIVLMFLGMNIGLSMFIVGFLGFAYVVGFGPAIGVLMSQPMANSMNYSLTVMPMFVLMGNFVFYAGMSSGLFDAAEKWFGRTRGGMAMATVVACALFGAICGSLPAAIITIGVIAYPEMRKRNYDEGLSSGALCAGATLGNLIPPSNLLIIYGIITETSIGKLFAAGILPGILMTIAFVITILVIIKINPKLAPVGQSYTMKEKLISLKGIVLTLLLFAIVIGGMFAGFFSSTEAAAVGAFVAFVIMFVKRNASWKNIKSAILNTLKTTAMSLMIILGAYMLGVFLAVTQMPMRMADVINSINLPSAAIMGIIILIYAFLGCIMDAIAICLLTVPIMLPVINGLGYDVIWFGVMMAMVMNLGAITPPVGAGAFITSGAMKVPLQTVFKGLWPYVLAFAVCFIVVVFWPDLSTYLPKLMYG